MATEAPSSTSELVRLTAELVSAYVGNNAVTQSDLPQLIASVHGSLSGLGSQSQPLQTERPVPPVPIKKSITPDYIISLEDGRRYKSLKRHLAGRGLTPEQYRRKWGLSGDYPMVAPNYAKQRSELAKAAGLGRKRESVPAQAANGRRRAGR
ncbi:MucR family transcriptional regulator [Enterovirga aerilata]|uniref:MucR family transcriptional regulator n=1 Tax=Enterovirga aerilata TaxID=2730920 RepID=A0A849IGG7_9HYPH|nr:MucR family transcriptional regulator [Enterovirga sp. DB1703]NNM73013.1 MucR family transcriptional regulator [Enterovirga sp. DB1703]